jgi:type I restriction enzyme S subunit
VLTQLIKENGGNIEAKRLWEKSGLSIDEFYSLLKREIDDGFIAEPKKAESNFVEVVS